jgi:flagellar hook-associated protein 2
MDDQIANKERQLARKEDSLRAKFAKLEETMSRMKAQAGQIQAAGFGGGIPGMG